MVAATQPGMCHGIPVLPVRKEGIPRELWDRPQWVMWKGKPRDGKPGKLDKIPYQPRAEEAKLASSTDPSTWATAGAAVTIYEQVGGYEGIGFVPTSDDPFVGIDLDDCREPSTGRVEPWAEAIVDALQSYTEVSPSGTGLRIIAKGKLPPEGRRKNGPIEMYETSRFLTFTGHRLSATPATIEERQGEIVALNARITPQPPPDTHRRAVPTATMSDAEIMERCERARNSHKYRALMSGDTSMHGGDDSAADAALCSLIAFWTQDAAQIERIFSHSTLARRGKWQRQDYRRRTVDLALSRLTASYEATDPDRTSQYQPSQMAQAGAGGPETAKALPPGWTIRPLSELSAEGVSVSWLWGGYLAPGALTLYTGLWKVGKTTHLKYMLKSFGDGSTHFCGQMVRPLRCLMVSEESQLLWAQRRDDMELGDNVDIINKPFTVRPTLTEWVSFVAYVAEAARERKCDLVIFDSLYNLWGVKDENDAAEVLAALTPLNMLTAQGTSVLVIAHPKKGDAGEGQATRGTGAIGGYVDIILEMRRYDAPTKDDTRRVLTAYSRWDETPPELVIALDRESGVYTVEGTKADARTEDRLSVLLEMLPVEGVGKTPAELRSEWVDERITRPSEKTIRRDLDTAVTTGRVKSSGVGTKNNPVRYHRA
jgi:putative DNA primase/helicase